MLALAPSHGSALPTPPEVDGPAVALDFETLYEAHFDFVWRSVRRLGVSEGAIDDVVQETFLIVHRRLAQFEGRSSVNTWLFGILRRVVHDHRRHLRRKSPHSVFPEAPTDPESLSDAPGRGPHESVEKAEAVRTLHAILDELEDDKRELFILAELEQMTVPEISLALGTNLNTTYSRLRVARQEFDQAVARRRAREDWRYR
jgi:RNA polymerase sigma-70 factor (ECF subfamily)